MVPIQVLFGPGLFCLLGPLVSPHLIQLARVGISDHSRAKAKARTVGMCLMGGLVLDRDVFPPCCRKSLKTISVSTLANLRLELARVPAEMVFKVFSAVEDTLALDLSEIPTRARGIM